MSRRRKAASRLAVGRCGVLGTPPAPRAGSGCQRRRARGKRWPRRGENAVSFSYLLNQLKDLHTLNLTQTAITDAGLRYIESLPQLHNLFLPVNITDAGLVHVKGLTQLEHLSLLDSQVSDAGLVHLKGLQNLKSLLLNGTQVTDAGLREIRQALPRARIDR